MGITVQRRGGAVLRLDELTKTSTKELITAVTYGALDSMFSSSSPGMMRQYLSYWKFVRIENDDSCKLFSVSHGTKCILCKY